MIQPDHRPSASKQHNSNRIKAERPESNRRPESDSVSFPLAYIPHNPDSRVSKVFNVSCLPRVVRIFISFLKKSMNNKNLNQGGESSCVSDDKYARQDLNLFNFPSKRAHQLQKIKERRIKTKMSKTTVLFVLPAAQLHYNRFLLTTSLPLLCFYSISRSFSTYLLTRSRSSRHSASLDISLISVVSSSRCSSRAASIFLLQSSDLPER